MKQLQPLVDLGEGPVPRPHLIFGPRRASARPRNIGFEAVPGPLSYLRVWMSGPPLD